MKFKDLGLVEPILKALEEQGYENPTEIQEKSIPILLEGKDLLGCAQTGTGKTAAFSIPIIQHVYNAREVNAKGRRKISALVVTPTRELAIQIADNVAAYTKYTDIKSAVIFGGVKQGPQTNKLRQGIDILIATPGRLLDLMSQGYVSLKDVKYSVLDEADQMLDMGFIHDIRKIIAKLPNERQSLFFSATMPPDIVNLSHQILGNPEKVTIKPEQGTAERVEQIAYHVTKKDKPKLLIYLIREHADKSLLVFSRTKHGADKLVKKLRASDIVAEAIHGNKSQGARQRALGNFKAGDTKVLIATDIAARGIDVKDLPLVINYELPNVPETYVHRIGRTGRAKASGLAISFCDGEERAYLKKIEKLINQDIPLEMEHPYLDVEGVIPPKAPKQQRNRGGGGRRNNNGGGGGRNKRSGSSSSNKGRSNNPRKRS